MTGQSHSISRFTSGYLTYGIYLNHNKDAPTFRDDRILEPLWLMIPKLWSWQLWVVLMGRFTPAATVNLP